MYRDNAEAQFARLEAVMRENEELRRENDELRSWTGATTRTELLLVAALTGPEAPVESMRAAFETRRRYVVAALNAIPHVTCRPPEGAFYAFFDVRAYLGKSLDATLIDSDTTLAELLLERAHCAFVPGSAFCAPGHLRMSYAASQAQLEEGLRRLADTLALVR